MPRNDGFTYEERLPADADGVPLQAYLSRRYRHSSTSDWAARIASGEVLVDSRPLGPDAPLRRGQTVTWRRPPWDEPPAPHAFEILHEDADVLAVSKPAGLPTIPGANFLQSTLLFQVRRHAPDASALHRLGRWTSGVVLFARSSRARAELSRQLRAREIRKRYRALASGDPAWDAIVIEKPIGEVRHPWLGSVHAAVEFGKPSTSRVEVLARRPGAFLCDVHILTGRPHQIRIHLAAAGHPLAGDPLYPAGGVPAIDATALPGQPGYLLHATDVTFTHPRDGREVVVASPPPLPLRLASWCDPGRDVTLDGHEPESRDL